MTDALIVFVRRPELGNVKTRLAAAVGDAKALAIYKKLLQHTFEITHPLPCDKYTFVAGEAGAAFWNGFFVMQQEGTDLGQRMHHAFAALFEKGYDRVVIIGSDCVQLNTALLQQAFTRLTEHRVVLGPATDGGYYLLGLTHLYPALFQNKRWSTNTVFADTLHDLETIQVTPFLLPTLSDVDELHDVPAAWL